MPLTLLMRDASGKARGGIRGVVVLSWLQIDHFWVDEALRGQRHGSALPHRAEDEGSAQLTTSTFQAVVFYEKNGYHEIGRLDDRPPGQDRVCMAKRWA